MWIDQRANGTRIKMETAAPPKTLYIINRDSLGDAPYVNLQST